MLDKVEQALNKAKAFVITTPAELENFRMEFISKKSVVNELFTSFKDVENSVKKEFGVQLNSLKVFVNEKFKKAVDELESNNSSVNNEIDFTLPPIPNLLGSRHPISSTLNKMVSIFERIGFDISEGPEIEDDWHNFTCLNFPENHPAREMQDTFFIEKNPDMLLRTHTSSVQVRVMENQKPPIRTLSPGRVYRNEAISARAHCIFHQVEGLYINENVSFIDLKETIYHFAKEMFGEQTKIRFRPSYFPFTEPSAEVDVSCNICSGNGCNVCKHTGWLEVAGAGMVDPNVLENCGIDSNKYSGFAFGMGVERIAMLNYQIKDLRLFTENDIRFLRQFKNIN